MTGTSITRRLRRGQKLARAGRTDEALAAFAEPDSDDPRLLTQHALALARAGRIEEAVARVDHAESAAPDNPVPALFGAYLKIRQGDDEEAANSLRRAEELAPDNPLVPTLSAARRIVTGRVIEGCMRLLLGPITDNLEVLGWVLARVEQALFEAVGTDSNAIPPDPPASKPDEPPDDLSDVPFSKCVQRGEHLLETGRPKSAAAYLLRAIEEKPDDLTVRGLCGAALAECGRFREARVRLEGVPQDSPLGDVAQLYRAAVAYRLGDYERALTLVDTLPMEGDVFLFQEWCDYIRGMILVALGRIDEAALHLAVFLDAEPDLLKKRLTIAIKLLGERKEDP